MPPRPSFTLRSSSPALTTSFSMRSFMAATSRSTLSLIERGYRNGWIISRNSAASAASPATPRALINIIRSQVWPHCA